MKYLLLIIITLLMIGCNSDTPYVYVSREAAIGNVREYNTNNSINKVNVYISMGQSNSVGRPTSNIIGRNNIFMPVDLSYSYPETITFKSYSNNWINKADFNGFTMSNTTTKLAEAYNSTTPLYIIHIARGGMGLDTGDKERDQWSPYRADTDGMSLHPQAIHYIETVINQLQAKGLEPYVIGVDWNQWESEQQDLEIVDYFNAYLDFFRTIDTVIPNKDYKLFICKPTSIEFTHTAKVTEAYYMISNARSNVIIYDPTELSSDLWIPADKVHYNDSTHSAFAQFILNEMGVL